ncbi:MAG: hypothetical protein A4S14_05070 [Proteobacteria bacterium SG_bin9]|nr:MAG: hypothetical protein A4S14_05070 [Proteobacteria bacterium SG_bin9]
MAAAALLALGIFIVDAFSPFGVAIAVLYVVVLLVANQFASRNGLILIGTGCFILTVIGFLFGHGNEPVSEATFRFLISLSAIIIATALLLRGRNVIAALEESEARYRMFLNISAVSFWRLDVHELNQILANLRAAGVRDLRRHAEDDPEFVSDAMKAVRIADVNHRGVERIGARTRDELIGQSVRYGWPKSTHDVFLRGVEAIFNGETSFQAETRVRTMQGNELDTLFCMSSPPEILDRGTILVAHIDITEQIEARKALAGMQADLAHAARLSMLGELTASIAHEVNQPLAAMATNGEAGLRWLERAQPHIEEARTALARIIADARRAADVIVRIRGIASKAPPAKAEQAVNPVIDETLQFVQHELQTHGVEVRLDLAADLPNVLMDRVQIQQVLSNLIVNAVQAMSEHGFSPPCITISSHADADGLVRVVVADNGPGIDADDRERLFDSFFTTKPGGMGLGLPISRSIVEAHGGTIAIDEQSGGGARFTVKLPSTSRTTTAAG